MADDTSNAERDLAAGDFASWVTQMQGAIRGDRGSDVPCGGCTACCRSSQFVHIGPDETDTLAHVPADLLFPAPLRPAGHVVLGYDERGHCPMLIDDACSIYEHRPRTCRTYDCRIFPASGLELADDDKPAISRQARRWRFNFPTEAERTRYQAVQAAAAFLREHPDALPIGSGPASTSVLAGLAVELHALFLRHDADTDRTTVVDPDPRLVSNELIRLMS